MANGEAITVGGYPLSGILQGARYKVTRLGGWWERPGIKRDDIARERADGDFPTPWNFEARHVSIDGVVTTKNHEQQHHVIDQLLGLCATKREWLTVQGHGKTQAALVEADEAHVTPITGTLARFELRFKASDPRKTGHLYTNPIGPEPTFHAHSGNYPATPTIKVSPSNVIDGFLIEATYGGQTRRWEWIGGAWSTQDHHIDLATGKHLVNGIEEPDRLGAAELWHIPPHTQVAVTLTPIDQANRLHGELVFRDTWI